MHAVDGIDLEVRVGEVIGTVGESGSVKSMMLRALLNLLHANAAVSGRVRWRGADLLEMEAARLREIRGGQIAMVFQEPMSALNPVLSIGMQIDEALVAHTTLDRSVRICAAAAMIAPSLASPRRHWRRSRCRDGRDDLQGRRAEQAFRWTAGIVNTLRGRARPVMPRRRGCQPGGPSR